MPSWFSKLDILEPTSMWCTNSLLLGEKFSACEIFFIFYFYFLVHEDTRAELRGLWFLVRSLLPTWCDSSILCCRKTVYMVQQFFFGVSMEGEKLRSSFTTILPLNLPWRLYICDIGEISFSWLSSIARANHSVCS